MAHLLLESVNLATGKVHARKGEGVVKYVRLAQPSRRAPEHAAATTGIQMGKDQDTRAYFLKRKLNNDWEEAMSTLRDFWGTGWATRGAHPEFAAGSPLEACLATDKE